MSSLLDGNTDFFGLDIGTTAIRLVQLKGNSSPKSLVKYAYVPIDSKLSMSDSKIDQQKVVSIVSQLIKQSGLNTRNVAVGIPSSKVFTTVADIERMPPNELAKAIPFEADSLIPTPFAESKIDWALIGDSPADKTKQEILLTSVPNKFIEERLDRLETIGLNVIAYEPDNLAMARALATAGEVPELLLEIGHYASDIVIVAGAPRLTRSIPTGVDAILKSASQNLNVDPNQAQEFVFKFGLSKDKLDGQVMQAIAGTVDQLVGEIEKSIKFFTARYDAKIGNIVVTGGAAVIPELPLYIANKFGVDVEIGNVWQHVNYPKDRENELLGISHDFAVAVGLAERTRT